MNKYKKVKNISWSEIEQEALILDSHINQKAHALNELGTFIWNKLDGENTEADILDSIVREYEIDEEVAKKDLHSFIDQLINLKLIE